MNMMTARAGTSLRLPAAFFAFAATMLVLHICVTPWGAASLPDSFAHLRVLGYVHTLTLGFIASILIGASYQLVPVLIETRLRLEPLAWASLALYAPGVAVFLLSIQLEHTRGMAIGGFLLAAGMGCYIICVIFTVLTADKRSLYGSMVSVGALLGGLGVAMGAMLALNKGQGQLGADGIRWLGAHIVFMIIGWAGLTYITVATKLVAMFTLSEKWVNNRQLLGEAVMLVLGAVLLAASFFPVGNRSMRLTGAILATLALLAFGVQLRILYRKRVRKAVDVHMPFAVIGSSWLVLAAAATVVGVVQQRLPGDLWWNAVIWGALWGGFATVIMGFLLKIASFLLWLHRYAPLAGRTPVPGLQDLYHTRLAYLGLLCWCVGVVGILFHIRLPGPWLLVPGVTCLIVGGAAFLANMLAILRHLRADPTPQPDTGSGWKAPHLQAASHTTAGHSRQEICNHG